MSPIRQVLADLKVLDLTTNVAGPVAARLFGELGADVVHVEPPHGDDGRNTTTRFLGREGTFHTVGNRNKRGIVIDLKTERGLEVMKRMLEQADFFVENMTKGTLDDLGLGWSTLHALNPRLIQLSITGWGQNGPLAHEPGYDVLVQAFTGAVRSDENREFRALGGLRGDPTAPLLGAFAAMGALYEREQTGRGSLVTSSVLQGAIHMAGAGMVIAHDEIKEDGNGAGPPLGLGGLGPFWAADGKGVFLCAWNDRQFVELCSLAGFAEVGEDPAHATRFLRGGESGARLNALFGQWVGSKNRDEIVEEMRARRIPVSPINETLSELEDDPHIRENDLITTLDHPTKGRLSMIGAMYEIDGDGPEYRPAPLLGEHTDEVLSDFGFSAEQVSALRECGAVA